MALERADCSLCQIGSVIGFRHDLMIQVLLRDGSDRISGRCFVINAVEDRCESTLDQIGVCLTESADEFTSFA